MSSASGQQSALLALGIGRIIPLGHTDSIGSRELKQFAEAALR
jgi:hypothetical protein